MLAERLGENDVIYLDNVESVLDGWHTLLVGALDARTAELTDKATGYSAA